jgi:signal transduction histidine kinase
MALADQESHLCDGAVLQPAGETGRMVIAVTAGAVVVAVVSAAQLYFNWVSQGYDASFPLIAASKLVEWFLWAVYVPVIVIVERRYGFRKRPFARSVLVHAVTGLALFIVANGVLTWFSMIVDPAPGTSSLGDAYMRRAGAKIVPAGTVYAAILAGYWLLHLREERHREGARNARLQADLSEARLLNFKMKMHPHFLFNALHTVAGLVRQGDRDAAVETIEELSELLRWALRDLDQQEVSLREELEFMERYFRIQQYRFGDRLATELVVEDEVRNALVPSLVLQPLAENAIRHGLDLDQGAGQVRLIARRVGDSLILVVEDNGAGMTAGSKEGLGLGTTRQRLHQLYGADAALSIVGLPGRGTRVEIRLPYHVAPTEPALAGSRGYV